MKAKITAVIPVAQYANIQPEIEAEADTYEEALAIVESRLSKIWNKYVEPGKQLPEFGDRVALRPYAGGGTIYYDKQAHVYTDEAGNVYLSGSQYADTFRKPFDKEGIANMMAKKIKADPKQIIDMWELKGEASRDFGNAVHKALQLYETHRELAERLKKTTHLHDNFVLKDIVESFVKDHKEKVVSEALVVDHKARRAGQIDRLVILGDKHGRVTDYKTGDASKNLDVYFRQLEFYTDIMKAAGWKMESPVIYEWNGKWKTYTPPTKGENHANPTTPSKPRGRPAAKVARPSDTAESEQVRTRLEHYHNRAPKLAE